jgi:hypothetical protein
VDFNEKKSIFTLVCAAHFSLLDFVGSGCSSLSKSFALGGCPCFPVSSLSARMRDPLVVLFSRHRPLFGFPDPIFIRTLSLREQIPDRISFSCSVGLFFVSLSAGVR